MANPGWSKAKKRRERHLDKDAAGRLLEGASDRTSREMIIATVVCRTEPGL